MNDVSSAPREELERRLRATEDALDFALRAAKCAKQVIDRFAGADALKDKATARLVAFVEAVASAKEPRENFNAASKLAYGSYCEGLREAADLALDVGAQGNAEWRAACKAVSERILERANLNERQPWPSKT